MVKTHPIPANVVALALALVFAFTPSLVSAQDLDITLRLPIRHTDVTDADPGPAFASWTYPQSGLHFEHEHFWIDATTPMLFVIVDGIIFLVAFLAAGSDELPMFDVLNSDPNPGFIRIIEGSGGMNLAQIGPVTLGAGLYGSASWTFPSFEGERINHQPFDVGLALRASYRSNDWSAQVEVDGGNGFHSYGSLNPFVHVTPTVDIRIWEWLGLHVAGRVGYRMVDYTKFESRYVNDVDPEPIRGRTDHITWFIEAGPSLHF